MLSPSLDSFSSDEDQDDEHGLHSRPFYSLSRDAQLACELDLSTREDRAVYKQTPFTIAKKQTDKKARDERAAKSLSTRRGNIQPASLDGWKPAERKEPVKSDQGGTILTERPPYWKSSGWYNNHNQPIIANAPPNRSFPSAPNKSSGTGNTIRKTKKRLNQIVQKGKKGGVADEDDRPIFRRIRELHLRSEL